MRTPCPDCAARTDATTYGTTPPEKESSVKTNPDSDPWAIREERFDYQPVRQSIRGAFSVWTVAIVVVGLVVLTAVLLWAFGVFTSDVKGQGDAEKVKNSAANRIRAQEGFEDLFAEIQASDRNITIAAETARTNPGDKSSTELAGLRQYCNGLVGDYNAKARKFTAGEFRAADLPKQIDLTDSSTDCKE